MKTMLLFLVWCLCWCCAGRWPFSPFFSGPWYGWCHCRFAWWAFRSRPCLRCCAPFCFYPRAFSGTAIARPIVPRSRHHKVRGDSMHRSRSV